MRDAGLEMLVQCVRGSVYLSYLLYTGPLGAGPIGLSDRGTKRCLSRKPIETGGVLCGLRKAVALSLPLQPEEPFVALRAASGGL